MEKLFGTSGIRRLAAELTDEFAMNIGKSAGTYAKGTTIAVAMDPRESSERLKKSLVAGINSAGKNVVDLGIAPTPTLGMAAQDYGTGIMITASHNPPQYNGFKFWSANGAYRPEEERAIEGLFYSKGFATGAGTTSNKDYTQKHISRIIRHTGRVKPVKVLLDCANGAGAVLTPDLLDKMGANAVSLNTEVCGVFAHGLEPTQKNLEDVCRIVKENGADIGLAHDGDADRTAGISRDGKLIDWDDFLSVLAYGKKRVVTTVDASMRIEDVCGEVIRVAVGDVAVANKISEVGADFGGEPSGSYIFPNVHNFPDGPLTAGVVVRMVSDGTFYETLEKIPKYPMERVKIPCADSKKMAVMEYVKKNAQDYSDIDGVRIASDDGWVLIRPSGTEPFMRVTAEGKNKAALKKFVDFGEKLIKEGMD
ncbi:MAG: hypothetical protein MSIBF_00125 [Candidatus Altiarchaeales archaeon IMC4]|nr:MAG: hypothetical protein MSIBF_00125 [Candidatus Altiarchaeales archaeon IMC4]